MWNHICNGNIVSENAVLTSRDCGSRIFHDSKVQVKMGSQEDEITTSKVYDITLVVKGMAIGSGASITSPTSNLALAFTKGNITFNEWTRPICLFNPDYFDYSLDNDKVIWSGWNKQIGLVHSLNVMLPLVNASARFEVGLVILASFPVGIPFTTRVMS